MEQEQLLQVLDKLKEVFHACGEDAEGCVRVSRFVELGARFGRGDEVKQLADYLDRDGVGRISFRDFCHGVFAVKGCEQILKTTLEAFHTDNGYYYRDAATLGSAGVTWPHLYLPVSQCGGGVLASGSRASDGREESLLLTIDRYGGEDPAGTSYAGCSPCSPSGTSDPGAHSPASLLSSEEQFEDYGESADVDLAPGSPGEDGRTNGFSDLGSSVASSAGQTPQKVRQMCCRELLDVYCSQCCKKVNLLNDLEVRLKNLKANSPNRNISSAAFGRQLFNNGNLSSSDGSTEDLFWESMDSCEADITEKVSYLEKKVNELETDSVSNEDLKCKLKQDNTQLVHRLHEMEEQMKDQEMRAEQTQEDEQKRHRETYMKVNRDKGTEIEFLSNRLQVLEEENGAMRVNVCRLRSQTEKLDQEKQRVTDKLEDTSLRLKDEMDLYRKMLEKLWQNRREFSKERESMQELIEDLRRELDYLQLFKMETEHPGSGRSGRSRESELEYEVKRLKQENFKLRDQNEDLNGQILSLSVYEAKSLFESHSKAQCLAAEIDNASRDELVDALKEQEEINFRLRQYMDKIILAILDHNPSILEIKS